ncbi:endonuclease domain-containing protein [Legionella shakespearei]|uniref:Multidrug efflux protein n=1 Tax=Legionella shakespearei DSM 23087 TaxID=1122169 RepID=A0A0W0YJY3_9GAMM|nr:endonuclease domain-containing protein [Legionella shakespearei]KTD57212.1 multidrug efflux protein [Legionella shakespearei DSM 23087]
MVKTDEQMRQRAKLLRQNTTDAEQHLWFYLRAHRLQGYKFKRQVPIGNYIIDFICTQRKLIVELDGGQHILNKEYDEERTSYLNSLGYIVLRFWNDEVLLNIENVLESIFMSLEDL